MDQYLVIATPMVVGCKTADFILSGLISPDNLTGKVMCLLVHQASAFCTMLSPTAFMNCLFCSAVLLVTDKDATLLVSCMLLILTIMFM